MLSAPVPAVDAAADHFDFFLVADGFGADGFGLGVVENAEGDFGGVALVLVPGRVSCSSRMRTRFLSCRRRT